MKAYIFRFIRTVVPQLVLLLPVLIDRGQDFEKYLPVWVIPTLICLGGIFTALDKFFRDIGFYDEVKSAIINK